MKKVLVWVMSLCLLCGLVQESALMVRASEDDYEYESGGVQEEDGLTVSGNDMAVDVSDTTVENDAVVDVSDTTTGSDIEISAAVNEELDVSTAAVSGGDNILTVTDEISYVTVDISDMVYQSGGWGVSAKEDESAAIALYATNSAEEDLIKTAILEALQGWEDSLDITAYGLTGAEGLSHIKALYAGVINEHPELFYVGAEVIYSYYKTSDEQIGQIVEIKFSYATDRFSKTDVVTFEEKLEQVTALVNGMSNEQKALVLHDYLAQHCTYAYKEYLDEENNGPKLKDKVPNVYNAYGALVGEYAVCQGYALAYSALLHKVGIDADICSSETMNHAWNVVSIDDNWYHVDVTWDDPTWNREGRARHLFFLLSDDAMGTVKSSASSQPHREWDINGRCTSKTYDNHWWSDIDSQIVLEGGNYYYIKNIEDFYFGLYKRDSIRDTEVLIYDNKSSSRDCWWPVVDKPGSYYSPFAYLSKQGDYLYFNDSLNLYYMKVGGSEPKIAFTYDNSYEKYESGRYMYGAMVYDEGTARLNFFTDANASDAASDEYHIITFTLPGRVTSVRLNKSALALKEGGTEQLTATVEPSDAEDPSVSWSSDNEEVATVDEYGNVTAHKSGEATITVKTDDGGKTATCTVTVTCNPDNLEQKAEKASTCEDDGNIAYWICKVCGNMYKDSAGSEIIEEADVVIKATGHTSDNIWHSGAENPGNHWNECTICSEKFNVAEHRFTGYTREKEPTCTDKGSESRRCTVCSWSETREIEATGHAWNNVVFTWDENDYFHVTVVAICTNDPTHKDEVSTNVNVTDEIIEPTCTEDAKIIYTATAVLNDGTVLTDEKIVVKEGTATGHNWGEAVIEWAEDYSGAKVVQSCEYDPSHKNNLNVDVKVTEEVTKPTCEEDGMITYTATAVLDGRELIDTKTVKGEAATGHDWKAVFTWATDYSSVEVVATCNNDASHTKTVENVSVSKEITDPTCEEDGVITYTATVVLDGTTLTDTKTDVGEKAIGHAWGEAFIKWAEDYSSAKVLETCNNNPDHVYDLSEDGVTATVTEERTPATCTEAEVITYTAKASLKDGTELSDAKTVEGAGALGHEFSRYVLRNDGNISHTCVMCIRCDVIDEKATEIQAAIDSGNVKVDVSGLDLSKIVGDSIQQPIQVVLDLDEAKEEPIKKLEKRVSAGYKAISFIDVRLLLIVGSVSDGDSDLPELTENFGTVRLSLPVGIEHKGKNVIVYQLHGDEVITYQGLTVDGEGYVSFKIDRLSVFAIAVQEEAENAGGDKEPQAPPNVPGTQLQDVIDNSDTQAAQPKSSSSVPKTGDDSNMTLWISLLAAMVLALSSLLFYSRKRFSDR